MSLVEYANQTVLTLSERKRHTRITLDNNSLKVTRKMMPIIRQMIRIKQKRNQIKENMIFNITLITDYLNNGSNGRLDREQGNKDYNPAGI